MAEHTVLLVDADTETSELVRAAIAPYGCRGVVLADGNEVLSYPLVPSLIVLCIDPRRLGWGTAMRIKKHPVWKGVPLILTSAEATPKDFEDHQKLRTRAEGYEHKPLAIERLVDKIRDLLGGLEVQVSGEFELPPLDDAGESFPRDDFDDSGADRTRVAAMVDSAMMDPGLVEPELLELEGASFADPSPIAAGSPAIALDAADLLDAEPEDAGVALAAGGQLLSHPRAIEGPPVGLLDVAPHFATEPLAFPSMHRPLDDGATTAELAALREERDRLRSELFAATEQVAREASAGIELAELRETLGRLDAQLTDARQGWERAEEELARVTAERGSLGAERDGALAEQRSLSAARDAAQAERASVEAALAASTAERDGLRAQLDIATVERDGLRAQIEAATAERDGTRAQLDIATAERDGLRAQLDIATVERDGLRAQLEAATAERDGTRAQLDIATAERDGLRAQIDIATAERDAARAERDERTSALERARAEHAAEQEASLEARAAREQQHAADRQEDADRRAALEEENGRMQAQVLRAYHRMKADEHATVRARKALAIALTLLEPNDEPTRSS